MKAEYIQIGQTLKNYRLKRKLSLEKISNKTKISIQSLSHIEDGKADLIIGEFYQRSFIKSYARALRISEKKILTIFDNSLKKEIGQGIDYKKEVNQEKNKIPFVTEKIPTIPLIFFASLGLITILLINLLRNPVQSEGELAVIEPKPNIKLSKVKEDLTNEIENIKQEMPIKQTNLNIDDIDNYKIQENKNFLKQIIAKEDVWIEIKDFDENILLSTILKKNESFNLPNNRNDIIISASNAGALFLSKGNNNNSELGSFGATLDSVELNSLITNH